MEFEMISPGDLEQFVENKDALIIDLRTPEEYMERHIKNAVNIPAERLESCCFFPEDRVLILYCERGGNSLSAAKKMAGRGYQVKTVVGGIHAYRGKMTETY